MKQFHRMEAKLRNIQVDDDDEGDRRPRSLMSVANARKLCDCPWLYTNEVTECVLLSMLLRQLFSSLFRPL